MQLKRIGIDKLCHAKLIYDIESKKWLFNGPNSEICINMHQIQHNNENLYNFDIKDFLEFEKVMFEKMSFNPFIKINEFIDYANYIIKNKQYKFKIFETSSLLYKKLVLAFIPNLFNETHS